MADLMETLIVAAKKLYEDGHITQEEYTGRKRVILNLPAVLQTQANPTEGVVLTDEGQKRQSFLNDRVHRLGPFEMPQVSLLLADFARSAKSGALPLSQDETARLQIFKEIWSEWLIFITKERAPEDYPVKCPGGYECVAQVQDFRRVLAELTAIWIAYEQRRTAPGSKEPSYGGLVAALTSPKAQLESMGIETVKRSPGQSFISALLATSSKAVKTEFTPTKQQQNNNHLSQQNNHQQLNNHQTNTSSPASQTFRSSAQATTAKETCAYCKAPGHNIDICRKFQFKDAVCEICNGKGHTSNVCRENPDNGEKRAKKE